MKEREKTRAAVANGNERLCACGRRITISRSSQTGSVVQLHAFPACDAFKNAP